MEKAIITGIVNWIIFLKYRLNDSPKIISTVTNRFLFSIYDLQGELIFWIYKDYKGGMWK